MRLLFLVLGFSSLLFSANIISTAGGGAPTSKTTKDYYHSVTGYWTHGTYGRDGVFTDQLHCRIFRYGGARQNIPLVVFFIGWGGNIDAVESVTEYEDMMNDPFLSLVIMPEYDGYVDDNIYNWYWGNRWTDGNGKKWSVPWAHNGVVEVINNIKAGILDSILLGCTIDTNRIYCTGSSIGGTAPAQIGSKHPEIFAAVNSHAGWTRYWAADGSNYEFGDSRGCLSFADLTGGVSASAPAYCLPDTSVKIRGNADQLYLPLSDTVYNAYQYTDLNWYFNKTGNRWNYRNPGFESPYIFCTTGSQDDPTSQGDNWMPALNASRRGLMYYRPNAGHAAGGFYIRWDWMRNFRRDRSFLAFTNRSYDDFSIVDGLGTGNGYMNDLTRHGWDPETIIDETNHYHVALTGTGTADVTLRNLQRFTHTPGTVYDLTINSASAGQITADEFGLVTIPAVQNAAVIDLVVQGSLVEDAASGQITSIEAAPNPFNPAVTIHVVGSHTQRMRVEVFNVGGHRVADLSQAMKDNRAVWDASGNNSGMYIVKISLGNQVLTRTVCLVK